MLFACPATDDFFRSRIDHMIDPRHPLAVLASLMPWQEIEARVTKNLSVNYVYRELHFAERDDGGGDVVECDETAFEFFTPHEQLAEAIEPAMANLDHPAPRLPGRVAPLGSGLLAAINDVGDVAVALDDPQGGAPSITGIGTQVLAAPGAWCLALDHDGPQNGIELRDIMRIRSCHVER